MPGLYATAIPPEGERVEWHAAEVIVELFGEPLLLLRVSIEGPHFPARALEPIVDIGGTRSRFVRISDDGLRADAFFERMPTSGSSIQFGHGPDIELVVPEPFSTARVERLDRRRLPPNVKSEAFGGHAMSSAERDAGAIRREPDIA